MDFHKTYRPSSFDEIVGNQTTVNLLRRLIKDGKLPKTMMFCGPSGCGKTTLAKIIKNELKCSDVDFTELNAANTRGIDTIREVIDNSKYVPFSGGNKIFLFDEAHKITTDAQNALLKLVEDTPPNAYFILCTTDPGKLILTLRDRCTPFPVKALTLSQLVSLLRKVSKTEGKNTSEDVLLALAQAANGSPRHALVALGQVIDLPQDQALELIKEIEIGTKEIIDICRALVKEPRPSWKEIAILLKKVEITEQERARLAIIAYLASTLVNSGRESIGQMMEHFAHPFYNPGRGELVNALWKACKDGN